MWKPINQNYKVSNDGKIKNRKGQILKTFINDKGYEIITLSINGKQKNERVHRLVAKAFIQNKENKPHINHKDGNKLNNSVDNLEWVNRSENIMHRIYLLNLGVKTPVRCVETGKIYQSQMEAERATGAENISGCCTGRYKTSGGYHWEEITEGDK